jgi:hypothetical protein
MVLDESLGDRIDVLVYMEDEAWQWRRPGNAIPIV